MQYYAVDFLASFLIFLSMLGCWAAGTRLWKRGSEKRWAFWWTARLRRRVQCENSVQISHALLRDLDREQREQARNPDSRTQPPGKISCRHNAAETKNGDTRPGPDEPDRNRNPDDVKSQTEDKLDNRQLKAWPTRRAFPARQDITSQPQTGKTHCQTCQTGQIQWK